MKTIRFNGEEWYEDRRSLPKRIRQWCVKFLGWELPDRTDGAYDTRWQFRANWCRFGWRDPFPIVFFGHRISLFDSWIDVRLGWRHFHWGFRREPSVMYGPYGIGYAYLSRDGTPHSAHHWLWGAEKSHHYSEIAKSLKKTRERLAAREARRNDPHLRERLVAEAREAFQA